MGRKEKDGRLPLHPGPGKGWVLSPSVCNKRGHPSLEQEARLIFQTRKSQVVSAPRKRPSVGSACGLPGLSAQRRCEDNASSRGPAPAPAACPARPRRAHADAEDPIPPAPWGAGCRGPAGPVPAGQLGSAELERRGAPAWSSAGRAHIQLPPHACPPGKGKDGDLRVRSADYGPHPAPREAASGSPGCGAHGRPTTSTPAAQAPPRPASRGPRLTSGALSRAGARRWWPLQREGRAAEREPRQGRSAGPSRWIPSLPQLRAASPHSGTLPPAQPPPPGGRPPLRVTHQEHTPRQRPSLRLAHTPPPITPPWVLYPLTRTF